MLFSSVTFLYFFLTAVLLLYFLTPRKFKNAVLLFFSLIFYAYGEPRLVVLMLLSVLSGYVHGLLMGKFKDSPRAKKACLVSSVCFSLAPLLIYKYTDFFIGNLNALGASLPLLGLTLPIGISFYTFQIISYTADVYRGDAAPQKNPIDLAAYIALFPQLIAGPIVRYTDVERDLSARTHSVEKIGEGALRFSIGLGKKVLIANVLGELSAALLTAEGSILGAWVRAAALMLQIYFDFSGYSDMAIGLGTMLGFRFPENFNYPFISQSATEFWRRWHMTLGSWFRDYVYIPLGGSRVSAGKHIRNIFIVWFLTGFWHGASWNFILWGLFFGLLLLAEKFLLKGFFEKLPRILRHVYLLLAAAVSFLLFDAPDLAAAAERILSLFGGAPLVSGEGLYQLRSYLAVLLIAAVGATPLPKRLAEKLAATPAGEKAMPILAPLFMAALIIVSTAYLVDGSFNPFLYFRF
ncbi:MAG: MBOAT family protein [Clostridiales bacterium]|nr:MBOAT family protein [Clostridiales bacterium]